MGVAIGARAFGTGALGTTLAVPLIFGAGGCDMTLFVVEGWILFGAEAVDKKASALMLDVGAAARVTGVPAEAEGENGSVLMPLFVCGDSDSIWRAFREFQTRKFSKDSVGKREKIFSVWSQV